ncbi:MAG: HepT-like ribonuclease domain-containing protein [Bacteroidota bacterium]
MYFGVDYEIVWDVARNKVPRLRDDIKTIITSHNQSNQPT